MKYQKFQQMVFWGDSVMQNKPRKGRPSQNEKVYRVVCSGCGFTRFLTKNAALHSEKNNACKICHCKAIARRGYRVAVERGLKEKALEGIANFQLANLSNPEKRLVSILDELFIPYEQQKVWNGYILDFVLPGLVIEVNGEYWHRGRENRDSYIAQNYPDPVLFIDSELVVKFPQTVKDMIKGALSCS